VRIAAIFGAALFVVVLAAGLFAYRQIADSRLRAFSQRLESLALSLANTLEVDAISNLDAQADGGAAWRKEWQERLMRIVSNQQDIDSIYVLLPTNRPAQLSFLLDASKGARSAEHGELYDASEYPFMLRGFTQVAVEDRVFADEFGATQSAYAPLRTSAGDVVGIVGVDVLAIGAEETRDQVIFFCATLLGLALGAAFVVAALVRRRVRSRLTPAFNATTEIAAGKHDFSASDLKDDAGDEFTLLGTQIGDLARQLREREHLRATQGLYLSDELTRAVLANGQTPTLGGVERIATVLFADLAQYSRISGQLSPMEIVSFANEYLGAMTAVIEQHGGCLLDFRGDCIMAVFGAPLALEDHADRALLCAQMMQKRMNRLNSGWEAQGLAERWRRAGVELLTLHVGIHTGSVVAGHIGGASRMKYCVMGETVSIAISLEEMNRELGTRIAISDQVKQRAGADSARGFTDCDLRPLRGRLVGVHVFAL
jgi:adenylate cyclase